MQEDFDYVVSQFEQVGFCGGINYYCNIECNWEFVVEIEDMMMKVLIFFFCWSVGFCYCWCYVGDVVGYDEFVDFRVVWCGFCV